MNRREEPRFVTDVSVELTFLTENERNCAGRVIEHSGRGLRIIVPSEKTADLQLGARTQVKVTCEDTIFIGDICHWSSEGEQTVIGLEVQEIVTGARQLLSLWYTLVEEAQGPGPLPPEAREAREEQDARILSRVLGGSSAG